MRVFISHSAESPLSAQKLAEALRQQGVSTWLDRENLQPGTNFADAIADGLREADAIVFLLEPRHTPGREWPAALETAWADPTKRLIPLLVDNARLPAFLSDRTVLRIQKGTKNWRLVARDVIKLLAGDGRSAKPKQRNLLQARLRRRKRLHEIRAALEGLRASG